MAVKMAKERRKTACGRKKLHNEVGWGGGAGLDSRFSKKTLAPRDQGRKAEATTW